MASVYLVGTFDAVSTVNFFVRSVWADREKAVAECEDGDAANDGEYEWVVFEAAFGTDETEWKEVHRA